MQKITIGTIVIFLCIVLGMIFFWWPKYKNFNNLDAEIKGRRVDLENKEKYFSELNTVWSQLKEHNEELLKIDSALPTTAIVPDLVNFLAEKSSQNGLILEKVNLEKISVLEKDSKIQKISLSLTLSGFYPALRNFISSLQKSAKLIEVNSIIFSESKLGGIFSFNLGVETYSY